MSGPLAKTSPKAANLADRLMRRRETKFVDHAVTPLAERLRPEDMDPDLFEMKEQTYRRSYFPPSGAPPN